MDLAMQPAQRPPEPLEVHSPKSSLKGLLEEADMEDTMNEVERPPSSSLLQLESTVEAGVEA